MVRDTKVEPEAPGAAPTRARLGSTVRRTGSGLRSAGGFVGRQGRRGAARVFRFTTARGAGESGLARLVHLQFLVAAGDAAIAVSLAGTLFFTLPTEQARPQVAQFLLLTMAPFAVVAPLIGPVLDRFRHGRRWAIGTTLALRAFLCWVLADAVITESPWLFPCALGCLVASKAFTVTRASAVPRLLPPAYTLVDANSRISMANVVGALVGGGAAFAVSQLGAPWSLRFAFVIFLAATVGAILLAPAVDSAAGERDIGSVFPLPGEAGDSVSDQAEDPAAGPPTDRVRRRFRSLSPPVRHGLRCAMGARLVTGFLTLFLAFLLREQPIADLEGTALLGIVILAAGVGNSVGTVVGNLAHRLPPERIALAVLCVDAAMVAATAAFYFLGTVLALGFVAGLCAQLAKLSYDALVQRDVPEVVRTSVFARSETVLQISWVFGGALGIGLPLIPQLGFGLVAAMLLALLAWTLTALRRGAQPAPARSLS